MSSTGDLMPYFHSSGVRVVKLVAGQISIRDGTWPDPTWAYFWPAVNKRPTRLWPGYFLTWPEDIFFDPKWKKFAIFRGNFPTQTKTVNSWPNPTQATKNWPDPTQVKNFSSITNLHHSCSGLAPSRRNHQKNYHLVYLKMTKSF